MTSFVNTGGQFPIMLLTCNRDKLLRRTLQSLLTVRGVTKDTIHAMQDGKVAAVEAVLKEFGISYTQHDTKTSMRGGRPKDGATRIAEHYGYALSTMFDTITDAPAVVVVEDDFLFSPDFLEYFHAAAPVLDADPTVWLASAWHDNGFAGRTRDLRAVRRTGYFPGLGWMIPRKLFKNELQSIWPHEHWDHWLRDARRHKGRDILVPEVPRDYHIGVKGTFMDKSTHNKYFASINVNKDPTFTWLDPATAAPVTLAEVHKPNYDARLKDLIRSGITMRSTADLENLRSGTGIVWITASLTNQEDFKPLSTYFHLWHEIERGAYHGIHELWWQGDAKVLIVNDRVVDHDVSTMRPPDAPVLTAADFRSKTPPYDASHPAETPTVSQAEIDGTGLPAGTAPAASAADASVTPVAATQEDTDCDAVCASRGMACQASMFSSVNSCSMLQQHFACNNGCEDSMGPDQPAMVTLSAPSGMSPGKCLVNTDPSYFSCSGRHKVTFRLCPCG